MVYSVVMVLCVEQPYKDEHCATALAFRPKVTLLALVGLLSCPLFLGHRQSLRSRLPSVGLGGGEKVCLEEESKDR